MKDLFTTTAEITGVGNSSIDLFFPNSLEDATLEVKSNTSSPLSIFSFLGNATVTFSIPETDDEQNSFFENYKKNTALTGTLSPQTTPELISFPVRINKLSTLRDETSRSVTGVLIGFYASSTIGSTLVIPVATSDFKNYVDRNNNPIVDGTFGIITVTPS